jgi:hypothetical protein
MQPVVSLVYLMFFVLLHDSLTFEVSKSHSVSVSDNAASTKANVQQKQLKRRRDVRNSNSPFLDQHPVFHRTHFAFDCTPVHHVSTQHARQNFFCNFF